jgi:glycosyltransferase involved in cell wall biosynthesis
MNVAIYHNLPSGGAKRALFNYTKGLVEHGHTVDVYAPPSANEVFLDLRPLVRRYHEIPLRSGLRSSLVRSPVIRELDRYAVCRWSLMHHARVAAEAIDAGGYDVAFVHHCQIATSPYILSFLTTPSVYYCQEPRRTSFEYSVRHHLPDPTLPQRAHEALFESLLRPRDVTAARSATVILANSYFSVESIKRAYGRYARVAYLGIDLTAFRASGQPRVNAVISVGALHPAKGHLLVIEAVGALPADVRPAVRIVADRGTGEHADELSRRAGELDVSLSIRELVSDAELAELYATSRVAICTAELEAFGFTPLEAMACGTPVIAVREGGFKETVIDGRNGRLCDRDPAALASVLQQLLGDQTWWEELSRGASESASRWSVERSTVTLERALAELPGAL